ncbi:hypothetical protein PLICRDRAFT_696932 [Plicaturopsis crispa FD-325 SS-3]|nr:hypothetical protein PLICRDRAFT_696932 [Plicaturopsis crispa FD-325 SS-3]
MFSIRIAHRFRRPFRSSRIRKRREGGDGWQPQGVGEVPRAREELVKVVEVRRGDHTQRIWFSRRTLRAIFERSKNGAPLNVGNESDTRAIERLLGERYIHALHAHLTRLTLGFTPSASFPAHELFQNLPERLDAAVQQARADALYRYEELVAATYQSIPLGLRAKLVAQDSEVSRFSLDGSPAGLEYDIRTDASFHATPPPTLPSLPPPLPSLSQPRSTSTPSTHVPLTSFFVPSLLPPPPPRSSSSHRSLSPSSVAPVSLVNCLGLSQSDLG